MTDEDDRLTEEINKEFEEWERQQNNQVALYEDCYEYAGGEWSQIWPKTTYLEESLWVFSVFVCVFLYSVWFVCLKVVY